MDLADITHCMKLDDNGKMWTNMGLGLDKFCRQNFKKNRRFKEIENFPGKICSYLAEKITRAQMRQNRVGFNWSYHVEMAGDNLSVIVDSDKSPSVSGTEADTELQYNNTD